MHGETETSMKTRGFNTILHAIIIGIVIWIYFGGGIVLIGSWFGIPVTPGDYTRRIILLIFGIILFVRLSLTNFYLLKRKVDWKESMGILFAIIFYQIGYALCGAAQSAPIGAFDYVAIAIFTLGSFLNTGSEIQRKRFKDKPENKGKLYTTGLFSLARHINYFGDTLWTIGWAILTLNWWSAILPVFCTLNFIFFMIPMLHTYLDERYKEQYVEWTKKTKKFIPFIY